MQDQAKQNVFFHRPRGQTIPAGWSDGGLLWLEHAGCPSALGKYWQCGNRPA